MNKYIKYIISSFILISLLSNSVAWALGDTFYLSPQNFIPVITGEFKDEVSSLSMLKSTVRWGITSNRDLEEFIWKSLANNKYERLLEIGYFDGKRYLIFNGARYIFSQDSPVIYRFSDKNRIDDPFGRVIEEYKCEMTTRRVEAKLYYRWSFIVTKEKLEFINSCLQTLYPEWSFMCRIPEGDKAIPDEIASDPCFGTGTRVRNDGSPISKTSDKLSLSVSRISILSALLISAFSFLAPRIAFASIGSVSLPGPVVFLIGMLAVIVVGFIAVYIQGKESIGVYEETGGEEVATPQITEEEARGRLNWIRGIFGENRFRFNIREPDIIVKSLQVMKELEGIISHLERCGFVRFEPVNLDELTFGDILRIRTERGIDRFLSFRDIYRNRHGNVKYVEIAGIAPGGLHTNFLYKYIHYARDIYIGPFSDEGKFTIERLRIAPRAGGNIFKWGGAKDGLNVRDKIIKRIFKRQDKSDNKLVSGMAEETVIPAIESAISRIRPETKAQTLDIIIGRLVENAVKRGILTEWKIRLIQDELSSLGKWAKKTTLGDLLDMAVGKLRTAKKTGFRGFIEAGDRFFLGGAVNRKGKDYLLYDVEFLKFLSRFPRGINSGLISEYVFHEAMELVSGKHQVSRLISMLVFPGNYRVLEPGKDRAVYYPYLRNAIRTFIVLNTIAPAPPGRISSLIASFKKLFKSSGAALTAGIIFLIPDIAYGRDVVGILADSFEWVVILSGVFIGIILWIIRVAKYFGRYEEEETILKHRPDKIGTVLQDAVIKYSPSEIGQCVKATDYIINRIGKECPGVLTQTVDCHMAYYPDSAFYNVGDATTSHSIAGVTIDNKKFIIDTQLKQFTDKLDSHPGFVERYIYPWDEYFLTVPMFQDNMCVERLIPQCLVGVINRFRDWAKRHSPDKTTLMDAYRFLNGVMQEAGVEFSPSMIKMVFQETIMRYFRKEGIKLAECLSLAAKRYKKLRMYRDSAICDEYAGNIYYELKDRDAIRSFYLASAVYKRLGLYIRAGECCKRMAEIYELFGDKINAAKSWALAGKNYSLAEEFKIAGDCYRMADKHYEVSKFKDETKRQEILKRIEKSRKIFSGRYKEILLIARVMLKEHLNNIGKSEKTLKDYLLELLEKNKDRLSEDKYAFILREINNIEINTTVRQFFESLIKFLDVTEVFDGFNENGVCNFVKFFGFQDGVIDRENYILANVMTAKNISLNFDLGFFEALEENISLLAELLFHELAHTYGINHQVLRLLQTELFPENYEERWNLLGIRIREFTANRLNIRFEKPRLCRSAIAASEIALPLETIEESIRSVFVEDRDRFVTNLLAKLNISRDDIYLMTFKPINEGLYNIIYEVDIKLKDGALRRFCLVVSRSDKTPKSFGADMGYLNPNEATSEDYKNLTFLYSIDSNYLPKPICLGQGKYEINMFAVEFLDGYEEINRHKDINPAGFHINWVESEPIEFEDLSEEKKRDILLDEETSIELRIKMIGILANYFFKTYNKKTRRGKLIDMVNINAGDFVYSKRDGSLKIITVRGLRDVAIEEFIDYIFNHVYYSDYPNLPPRYYLYEYEDVDEVFSGVLMGLENIYEKRKARERVIRYFRKYFMAIEKGKFKQIPGYPHFDYRHFNFFFKAWLKREVAPIELGAPSLFPARDEAIRFLRRKKWNLALFRKWVREKTGDRRLSLVEMLKKAGLSKIVKEKILEIYIEKNLNQSATARYFGFRTHQDTGWENLVKGLALDFKEVRLERGYLLKVFRLSKGKALRLINEKYKWDLPDMRDYFLPGYRGVHKNYARMLWGLDIEKEFETEFLERFQKSLYSWNRTSKSFGVTIKTIYALVRRLRIKPSLNLESDIYNAVGMSNEEVKELFEKHNWNLGKIMEVIRQRVGTRKIVYADIITALGLKKEFIKKFKEVYAVNGNVFGVTASFFGMEFHNFEKLLRKLGIDYKKVDEPSDFSGYIGREEAMRLLRETSWNLARLKEELLKLTKCQQITYSGLIRALGIESEFRVELIRNMIQNDAGLGALERAFGVDARSIRRLLRSFGIAVKKDEILRFKSWIKDKKMEPIDGIGQFLEYIIEEYNKNFSNPPMAYRCIELLEIIEAVGVFNDDIKGLLAKSFVHSRQDLTSYAVELFMRFMAISKGKGFPQGVENLPLYTELDFVNHNNCEGQARFGEERYSAVVLKKDYAKKVISPAYIEIVHISKLKGLQKFGFAENIKYWARVYKERWLGDFAINIREASEFFLGDIYFAISPEGKLLGLIRFDRENAILQSIARAPVEGRGIDYIGVGGALYKFAIDRIREVNPVKHIHALAGSQRAKEILGLGVKEDDMPPEKERAFTERQEMIIKGLFDEKIVLNNPKMFERTGELIGFSGVYTETGRGLKELIESGAGYFNSLTYGTGFSNYLLGLLKKRHNSSVRELQIRIARTNPGNILKKGIGRNEARYYLKDLDTAVIVFDEEFLRLLLRYRDRFPEAVSWVFMERLLHSLCHNNRLDDEITEEAGIILEDAVPLYEFFAFGTALGEKIDRFWDALSGDEKDIMQSKWLFRMLRGSIVYKNAIKEYPEGKIKEELLMKHICPYLRGEFLLDKDSPGKFINCAPENLEMALRRLLEKYGRGIIVPVDGIKIEEGLHSEEAALEGRFIKISPDSIKDETSLFSILEKGFLQRILFVIGGDKDKLKDAIGVFNDLIMARDSVSAKEREKVKDTIRLILAGLRPGQLRVMTALKRYPGLPDVINKSRPVCVRLDIDNIDEECVEAIRDLMRYTKDGIRHDGLVLPQKRLFLFSFYSFSKDDLYLQRWLEEHRLEQDDTRKTERSITLLSPDRLEEESKDRKDNFYLVLPYSRKSILMSAEMAINYDNLSDTKSYGFMKILYKELTGKEPCIGEIMKLFRYPWLVLPEPSSVIEFFNGIAKAEEIIMSSA